MNDEMLTLYYYDDGLTHDERQQVCDALAADSELAERYRQLSVALAAMTAGPVPALAVDRLHRFHDTIDRAARKDKAPRAAQQPKVHLWSFLWGAAITAALAVGIGLGAWIAGNDAAAPEDALLTRTAPAPGDGNQAFTRSMRAYFRDSRNELVNLPPTDSSDRTALIVDLIEQNRLYERAAIQNNDAKLARVLRAFEPILIRLASDDIAPEDAEALRAQLAFELNVMLTKLTRDSSDESHST